MNVVVLVSQPQPVVSDGSFDALALGGVAFFLLIAVVGIVDWVVRTIRGRRLK